MPDDIKLLSIFTDVFDCFFRFLSGDPAHDGRRAGRGRVLATVAACVARLPARSVPQLAERFRRYDLFAPEFALSCLNRLQLRNNQQMVQLDHPDPIGGARVRRHPRQPARWLTLT